MVRSGISVEVSKKVEINKVRGVATNFAFWVGVVVVVRRGCGLYEESKSIICDSESQVRWYLY